MATHEVTPEDVRKFNELADKEGKFQASSIPQALLCKDCWTLVPEDYRGLHFIMWHGWLEDAFALSNHSHEEDEDLD